MDIKKILNDSVSEADKLLKDSQALIDEIKGFLVRGSDTISQAQVEQWLLVIPVMVSELLPIKDAYELTRKLYTIDLDVDQSRAMLESTDKGAKREAQLAIRSEAWEVNKAIMYYIRDRAGDMANSLQSMLMSLMKLHNAKIVAPKEN